MVEKRRQRRRKIEREIKERKRYKKKQRKRVRKVERKKIETKKLDKDDREGQGWIAGWSQNQIGFESASGSLWTRDVLLDCAIPAKWSQVSS